MPLCGRPRRTRPGTCANHVPTEYPAVTFPACRVHLTPSERQAVRAALETHERAVLAQPEPEPACWSWTHRKAAAQTLIFGAWAARLRTRGMSWEALTVEEWARLRREAFVQWHERRCAVCGTVARRLVEDHCHWTGYVRGMLCDQCNRRDGSAPYRQRTAADVYGYRAVYRDPWFGRTPLFPDSMRQPEQALAAVRRWEAARDGLPPPV